MDPNRNNNLETPDSPPLTSEGPGEAKVESEPKSEHTLRQIRTFQGDVAEAIGKGKESLVSIQRAEKVKVESRKPSEEELKEKSGNLKGAALVLGSLILVASGISGGWYAYSEYSKKTSSPVISTPENRLISAERMIDIDTSALTRSEIINTITAEAEIGLPAGQVTHINIPSSPQEFFIALDVRAPSNLLRAFGPIFMMGTLGNEPSEEDREGEPSTFFLIRLSSFENAFAGMLGWENRMFEDIGPLFSTRSHARNESLEAEFRDIITRNKHTRVLYTPDGEVLLLYSFFDNNTLIITDKEESLRTLINRLSSELLSR